MTGIQWTNEVWNPTTGCDRVSAGCDNCYALKMAKRLKGMGQAKYQTDGDPRTSGPGFGLAVHPDSLETPLHWRNPLMIFVNSMSDLFHPKVPTAFIGAVFDVMAQTPQHTYQILTKRAPRMRSLSRGATFGERWPLPNVWLGVSAEDQGEADRRIPLLLDTRAAVRFVSAEPLLGPVGLRPGEWIPPTGGGPRVNLATPWETPGPSLDWVIVGGESGPGARRMTEGWARFLVEQCQDTGTAVFVKQLGSVLGRKLGAGSKGGDWERWPADLMVREFPAAAEVIPA